MPVPSAPPAAVVAFPDGRDYPVHFDTLDDLARHLREVGLDARRALVVTDETVGPLYLDRVRAALEGAGWSVESFAVPAGEASKRLEQLEAVLDWALALGIDRATPVLALGGGVVGDLAGFAAATLLRGLPLVHLPTTVIAQVDSAIGGKTGINHRAGKNLVGAFHQPHLVLADPATLATLDERDLRSGLAEVVKHGLIADAGLVGRLEREWDDLLARGPALARVVRDAASVKALIVSEDEFETGDRALLNFGHTFGHAVERAAGYGAVTHGEAVAIGMRAALHLSASLAEGGAVGDTLPAPFDRADALVARLAPPALDPAISDDDLTHAMRTDKKRTAQGLRFVVLDDIGRARLVSDVPEEMVAAAWRYARER